MAIDAVTAALVELLKASLGNEAGLPASNFNIGFGAPNGGAANADLVLFLYLITPSPELRNAERVRASRARRTRRGCSSPRCRSTSITF